MSSLCLKCHGEIAWLVERGRGYHSRVKDQRCASCHPDHAGRDFALISWPGGSPSRFDHAQAGWVLEGRHQEVACKDCHTTKYRVSEAAKRSHREGTDAGWVGLETNCTSCHEDAHHGSLPGQCLDCHDMRAWKPAARFDHSRTAYPLTGKHAAVPCASCHTVPGRTTLVLKPVAHARCSDCHRDPHQGRFRGACSDCHVTTGFSTMERGAFNHDRTRYPLRGRHAQLECTSCHQFTKTGVVSKPFATCGSCHADVHAGTATLAGKPADCAACHDVNGYRPATYTVAQHQTARFALEGRHAQVACNACHVKNPPGKTTAQIGSAAVLLRPVFGRCRDCHSDRHTGQLAARPDSGECASCHRVAGWTPSVYTVGEHAPQRFPLEGAHRAIPCAACHVTAGKFVFVLKKTGCTDCHRTPHGDQFATRAGGGACESCHDLDAFRPASRFDHDRDTKFPLRGGHQAVPCSRCHPTTGSGASARVVYRGVSGRCETCHGEGTNRS